MKYLFVIYISILMFVERNIQSENVFTTNDTSKPTLVHSSTHLMHTIPARPHEAAINCAHMHVIPITYYTTYRRIIILA